MDDTPGMKDYELLLGEFFGIRSDIQSPYKYHILQPHLTATDVHSLNM